MHQLIRLHEPSSHTHSEVAEWHEHQCDIWLTKYKRHLQKELCIIQTKLIGSTDTQLGVAAAEQGSRLDPMRTHSMFSL